jgi:hypothetical protein
MKKIQGMFFDGRISELQEKDNVISPQRKCEKIIRNLGYSFKNLK